MLAGRRQLSLDESGRRRLRRQSSEVRPIIAWQESFRDSVEKQQAKVEVVAKKIGQPKPTPTRPIRSPSIKNESALTLSRRQVAERLKAGWNKAVAKEGQDKGRQNLNIFLNKSFETRPESPHTPELGNGFRRSQSLFNANDDEDCHSDSSTESESEDDQTVKEKEEAKEATECAAPTPQPPPPQQQPQQPQRSGQQQQQQQRLSASARRAAFKAVGRQRPTTCSPEPKPRLMSAPPQPTRQPADERARSAPPRRRAARRPRRGVQVGEVVTMVSLVSPAESEEEAPPFPVNCPPTPDPPPTPPAPSPPPPLILSLRRPPKAVTFKSSMADGPQFRTNYPVKSPTILQEDKEVEETAAKTETPPPATSSPQPRTLVQRMGKPTNTLPSKPKVPVLQKQFSKPAAVEKPERLEELKKKCAKVAARPVQEEKGTVVQEKENTTKTKEKGNVADPNEQAAEELEKEEESPDFKSPKERECWQLFKRMSSRGVSVSFETVLRGLLTPTEYRMRRAALMASC